MQSASARSEPPAAAAASDGGGADAGHDSGADAGPSAAPHECGAGSASGAEGAGQAAVQLRWREDALPAGCKYGEWRHARLRSPPLRTHAEPPLTRFCQPPAGQHTGRAAGYQPPAHTGADLILDVLVKADQLHREEGEADDDAPAEEAAADESGGWGSEDRARGELGASSSDRRPGGGTPPPAGALPGAPPFRMPVLQRFSGVPGHMARVPFSSNPTRPPCLRWLFRAADSSR